MNLLEIAEKKFKQSKKGTEGFSEDLQTFLIQCYIHLTPASYGKQIQKRIIDGLSKCAPISDKRNCGDFVMGDFNLLRQNKYIKPLYDFYDFNRYFARGNFLEPAVDTLISVLHGLYDELNLHCEVKSSYLNKSGVYTVRNIRPYQNCNYYLLVFIDCENSFKPKVSLIHKNSLYEILHLTDMHGVKSVNVDVTNTHLGGTVRKNSIEEYMIFEKDNLLPSTNIEDLNGFMSQQLKFIENSVSEITLEKILDFDPKFNETLERYSHLYTVNK